jgi:hypothetical protein
MKNLIENITSKNYTEANSNVTERLGQIVEQKINEVRKMVAAKLNEVTVHLDGLVHTSTGERILPSVSRQRRSLNEVKKVDPRTATPQEFRQAKKDAAEASRKAVSALDLKKKLIAAQKADADRKEARQAKNAADMSLRREKGIQKRKKIRYLAKKRKDKQKDISNMHDLMRNDRPAFEAELEKRIGMPLDKAYEIITRRPEPVAKPSLGQKIAGMFRKK